MADYSTGPTPDLPFYAQQIVDQAEAEELQKQEELAKAQAAAVENESATTESTQQSAPEKPTEIEEPAPERQKQNALEYLQSGGSIAGNPLETIQDAALLGQGVLDTTLDAAASFLPWLKPVDDAWEEMSGKKDQTPEDKFVRDVSAIVIPTAIIGGPITSGLTAGATSLGFTGLTKGGIAALGRVGVDMAVGTGIESLSEQSFEEGNLSNILNDAWGIQTPWVTQEGDSEDVIYQNNMYESAALGGVVGIAEVALSSSVFGRIAKTTAKILPKNKAAQEALEKSNLAPKISFKKGQKPIEAPTAMESVARKDELREAVQTQEGIERLNAVPEGTKTPYDPFYNEPHNPQTRAIPDSDADPLEAKAGHAKIQNNLGTVNGRPKGAYTPGFKKAMRYAEDGTDRSDLLEEAAKGFDPQFGIQLGDRKLTSEQVEQAVDNLVTIAFKEPDNFKQEFSKLVSDSRTMFGNEIKPLSEDGFIIASEAYKKFLDSISPRQQRASAMLVSQSAANVSDASRAVSLIGGSLDTTRQQELAFDALRIMLPEIRLNQYLSGKSLQMKKLMKEGDKTKVKKFIDESNVEYDQQVKKTKKNVAEFLDTALEVSRQNPEFLKPLLREFERSNGEIDSILKLSNLAQKKITFWKKAFVDFEPEIPSLLVKQFQAVRYNHILTGLAPVRAAAGAITGLIGKPVTTFVGSKLTGDAETFKRAQFVYGGVMENIGRGFTAMADEWRYVINNPDEAIARGRKDFKDTTLQDVETMDEMAEAWRKNGENGKYAVWQLTKGLSHYNSNKVIRFGLNSMTALDAFTKSMSASMSSRARAYDELFNKQGGAFDPQDFIELQQKHYSEAFDNDGVLTDEAAKFASSEINLNMDVALVNSLDGIMRNVPAAKAIFMFPRTGLNAINLIATFSPTGILGQSIGRGRQVMKATTQAEIDDALVSHGFKAGDNAAFDALRSEYKGREIMGTSVTMGAGLLALNGHLTGSGPADDAEKRRMMSMGWKPYSIRDWNGNWYSYQGLEPFDTFLAMAADIVYESTRLDQGPTEDFLRTLGHSVTMNLSNKTFLSGFEPLARMISQDPGAIQRFIAMSGDSIIPSTGIRSILNKAISPQLKDIEYNWIEYLKNRNKFLPPVGNQLAGMVDVYTGKPINHFDPLTNAINSVLPFFKTNGGTEKWRQQLLATGWDNLQTIRTNPLTKQPLKPEERQWINDWIGNNYGLDKVVEDFFEKHDGFYQQELKDFAKNRGLKKKKQFPQKKMWVYSQLDKIHSAAFRAAWASYRNQNSDLYNKGVLQRATEDKIQAGDFEGASDTAQEILDYTK